MCAVSVGALALDVDWDEVQNRECSVITHVASQPMDLSDTSARVRLNMKRSLLQSQNDRSKQRRVLEDPAEEEVMIGKVLVC